MDLAKKIIRKRESRLRRHKRVRKKVFGTAQRPRLCVYRSLKHIYAQLIDDTKSHTLLMVSTLSPEIRKEISYGGNIPAARKVGALLARKALEKGIKEIVFDRGGYRYHGRVKALAEEARKQGLKF